MCLLCIVPSLQHCAWYSCSSDNETRQGLHSFSLWTNIVKRLRSANFAGGAAIGESVCHFCRLFKIDRFIQLLDSLHGDSFIRPASGSCHTAPWSTRPAF